MPGEPLGIVACRRRRPAWTAFGRVATDLRISLTDLCSLRCTYCMPAEGLDWLHQGRSGSTDDEFVRLAALFVGLGVRSVRLTGGEPLVHPTLRRGGRPAGRAATRARSSRSPPTASPSRGSAEKLADGRAATASTSRSTPWTGTASPRSPAATGSPTCCAGVAAAAGRRAAPVKINAVLVRGSNLRRGARPAGWALRARLPAALHRAHAAGRRPHLVARGHGHRRRDPRRCSSTPATRSSRAASAAHAPAEEFDVLDGPDCARLARAASAGSASSRRSPGRSAATATGCG